VAAYNGDGGGQAGGEGVGGCVVEKERDERKVWLTAKMRGGRLVFLMILDLISSSLRPSKSNLFIGEGHFVSCGAKSWPLVRPEIIPTIGSK